MPLLLVLGCVGFMFGTGGGALIAKTMGERKQDKANEIFTLIITVSALCGVVLAVLGFFLLRPVAEFMGAEGELLEQSIIYGRIILIALPFYILQFEFQCLFATGRKAQARPVRYRRVRRGEHDPRCSARRRDTARRDRRCGGHRDKRVYRRRCSRLYTLHAKTTAVCAL